VSSFCLPTRSASLSLALHLSLVTIPVDCEAVVPHDVFYEVGPQAEGVVELEDFIARYPAHSVRRGRSLGLMKGEIYEGCFRGLRYRALVTVVYFHPFPERHLSDSILRCVSQHYAAFKFLKPSSRRARVLFFLDLDSLGNMVRCLNQFWIRILHHVHDAAADFVEEG